MDRPSACVAIGSHRITHFRDERGSGGALFLGTWCVPQRASLLHLLILAADLNGTANRLR